MKSKPTEIDGYTFSVPIWSVKDRKKFLQELNGIKDLPLEKQYDEVIKFVASQVGMSVEQIEEIDAITVDKLFDTIIKSNTVPLQQR